MSLVDVRKKKNLTQEDMATALGIGISTYSMYENSQRSIPADVVASISKILGVKTDEIFLPTKFTISK